MAAKRNEGLKFMKDGDKAIAKTIFKWNSDFDTAASCYTNAANAFKVAKDLDLAKQAWIKSADAHANNNFPFLAAKALDTASKIAQDQKQFDESADMCERAAQYYREDDKGDIAASVLSRAARQLEEVDAPRAGRLYEEAIDIYVSEDKLMMGGDCVKSTIAFFMRKHLYEKAIVVLKIQLDKDSKLDRSHEIFKDYLSLVIVALLRGDVVAASILYQEALGRPGFAQSKENEAATGLLDAFEQQAAEDLEATLQLQVFDFLDNQVAKAAKSLRVAGSSKKAVATPATTTAVAARSFAPVPAKASSVAERSETEVEEAASAPAPAPASAPMEDDEDEGGLC